VRWGFAARHGEIRLGDLGVDRRRHGHDAPLAADLAACHGFQAPRLQSESQVHRLDGIAKRRRPGQIDHGTAAEQMDPPSAFQPPGGDSSWSVLVCSTSGEVSNPATSVSQGKWPAFARIAPSLRRPRS